eukprot:SAG22_NODE_4217_length_1340_cov_1.243352_1_plen_238_part_10
MPWAMLDVAESMVMTLRCAGWMSDATAADLRRRLLQGQRAWGADEQARAALICAELVAGRDGDGGFAEAMAHCGRGLSLQGSLSKAAASQGAAAYLHYLGEATLVLLSFRRRSLCFSAVPSLPSPTDASLLPPVARLSFQRGDLSAARAEAKRAEQANLKGHRLEKLVTFKLGVLTQLIGDSHARAFTDLVVGPRAVAELVLPVAAQQKASWEWTLKGFDIDFKVEYALANNGGGGDG